MGLRERAIEAYVERKKEEEEREKREAQEFAERRARDFERIFGVKPDKVQPVSPYECLITCDDLSFIAYDSRTFKVSLKCPQCHTTVFREVSSLADLGKALSNPEKCFMCAFPSKQREPSVEEQIVQKLREILDLLKEDEEW